METVKWKKEHLTGGNELKKSILDVLRREYESFTGAEKKIADYILSHQWESQGLGIAELSGECGVAVSTVSVFCRKLGLAGFNDFKIELARANTLSSGQVTVSASTQLTPKDTAQQVMSKACLRSQEILTRSAQMLDPEQVERAADLLGKAKQVLLLGQGNHSTVAMMAWAQFAVTSSKFKTVNDSHLQTVAMSTLSSEDVVVYFSYTGATLEIMDAVEIIRQVGAKLVLVTRFSHSPAAEFADAVLVFGADEGPLEFGSSDALISQIYVVEVLLGCYRLRNVSEVVDRSFVGKGIAKKML